MAHRLTVPAPAKVNLFLHVVGRRTNDGYHLIESAMAFLNFGDTITLETRSDGEITRRLDVPGVALEDDLCLRAARALRGHARVREGADISLEKRIPTGAGLGGGSSDAASVLLALNRLWNCNLPRAALMDIGRALGADVPFFLFGRAALARGIGEQLTAISVPTAQLQLAKPEDHAPTALVFSQPDLVRNTARLAVDALPLIAGHNDLQPVAERLFPGIAQARANLGERARMSGSGATVFVLTQVEKVGVAAWQKMTRILGTHPLRSFAVD
jgi:4-diphosphocytidyl-2-C-methyl-D-erythritol kinase